MFDTGEFRSLEPLGFPLYSVSDLGEVMNNNVWIAKAHMKNQHGYNFVSLYQGSRRMSRQVSALVAETFLRGMYPLEWDTIIHLDGDLDNCKASNLAYRPRSYAIRYNRAIRTADRSKWRLEHTAIDWDGNELYFDNVVDSATHFGILMEEVLKALDTGESPVFAPNVAFQIA